MFRWLSMSGYVLATLAALAWGLVYAFDQKVLERLSVWHYVFWHGVASVLVALPFVARNPVAGIPRQSFGLLALTFAVALVAEYLVLGAIQRVGASRAGIIEIAYPLFTMLFMALLYGERMPLAFYLGSVLIVVGAAVVAYSCKIGG